MSDLNVTYIQKILHLLEEAKLSGKKYSNIISEYSLTKSELHEIVYAWLTNPDLISNAVSIEFLHRHIGICKDLWLTQDDLFELGMKYNSPEVWKRVFDFAYQRPEWEELASPIVLFSKGLMAKTRPVWRNIFYSGYSYSRNQFSSVNNHFEGWKLLIRENYTYQEIFDLWLYTGCQKEILIEILDTCELSNQQIANFGCAMGRGRWSDIFDNSSFTTDLDKLLLLDIPQGIDDLIETGCIEDIERLLAYGKNVDREETWSSILKSKLIKDVDTIDEIIDQYSSCAYIAVAYKLSNKLSVLMNWASKSRNAWRHLNEHYLRDHIFPLKIYVTDK
jgi:hypothetical protein